MSDDKEVVHTDLDNRCGFCGRRLYGSVRYCSAECSDAAKLPLFTPMAVISLVLGVILIIYPEFLVQSSGFMLLVLGIILIYQIRIGVRSRDRRNLYRDSEDIV